MQNFKSLQEYTKTTMLLSRYTFTLKMTLELLKLRIDHHFEETVYFLDTEKI